MTQWIELEPPDTNGRWDALLQIFRRRRKKTFILADVSGSDVSIGSTLRQPEIDFRLIGAQRR